MPRVEQNGMPTSLHYALTVNQNIHHSIAIKVMLLV